MKHWLTHLILVILAVLFFDGTAKADVTFENDVAEGVPFYIVDYNADVKALEAEWSLPPRVISSANAQRVTTYAKRLTHAQRYLGGFYKVGKTVEIGIHRFISTKSSIPYSLFTKPALCLYGLGKLII